jgi:hypothetical protein
VSTVAPEAEVAYSRMAAALMNSPTVQALPIEQRWALRDVLAEHDSIDSLPGHVKRLFSESIHPHVVEAAFEERLHPRGRAGRWIDKPGSLVGDLIRGTGIRGGRGRRSPVKGKAKGWRERVAEIRSEPILQHRELKQKLDNAMVDADRRLHPWVPIEGGQGERMPGGEGDYQRGNVVLRHEVRPYGYHDTPTPGYLVIVDGEERGWTPYNLNDPSDTLDNLAFRVAPDTMPERERERRDFVNKWWGGAGSPGHYMTISGDPGVGFQEQHARIMEAGAHIDAEINRRLNEKGGFVKRLKQLEADQRDYVRWRKEAEKAEEDASYEAMARYAVQEVGLDPEIATTEFVKGRILAVKKERLKPYQRQDNDLLRAFGYLEEEHEYSRFNVAERVGIDLQALYDKAAEARFRERRGADDVRAAKAVLDEHRRDVAYEVLDEIRPFADEGDLQFIEETDRHSGIPWDEGKYSAYNAKYIVAPMLNMATVWLPRDWIRDSNQHPTRLVPGWAKRGHYTHHLAVGAETAYSGIVLSPDSPQADSRIPNGVGTGVHELVHRAESVRDGIRAAEWAFYASRVAPRINSRWEELKPLRELTGGGYEDYEKARPDKFVRFYCGKSYGDNPDSSWEILSMGIEDLVTGEHEIISQDEEYRHFVLGALATL